jgi:hypothetical protein
MPPPPNGQAMHGPPMNGPPMNGPPMNGQARSETAILPDVPPDQRSGGWPGGGWQPPPQGGVPSSGRSGSPSKPLIVTVVGLVVVAVVAAAVVLWPDGDDKSSAAGPSPAAVTTAAGSKTNPAARQEAAAVDKVLNASAASRGGLARAIAATGTCKGLPTAIAGFEKVATERRAQIAHARRLRVGHLANGTRLRQTLTRSIQYSLAVDQSLLTWARGNQGCKGKPRPDANYQRARGPLSAQASAAKRQFVALWTPVARQLHLRPRTANGF